jgi:hypothetical protein
LADGITQAVTEKTQEAFHHQQPSGHKIQQNAQNTKGRRNQQNST